jgi:hypothetical protein
MLPLRFNRIQAISALEVRVTAFSTSKIHAIKKINRTPAIGSILSHEKGVLFYRGVSPSKIGLIAPY